jgi:hypothetical protein
MKKNASETEDISGVHLWNSKIEEDLACGSWRMFLHDAKSKPAFQKFSIPRLSKDG